MHPAGWQKSWRSGCTARDAGSPLLTDRLRAARCSDLPIRACFCENSETLLSHALQRIMELFFYEPNTPLLQFATAMLSLEMWAETGRGMIKEFGKESPLRWLNAGS